MLDISNYCGGDDFQMEKSRIEWMGYDILGHKDEGIDNIVVRVNVSYQKIETSGEASGSCADKNLLRLIATATLNAVATLFSDHGVWYVEDVIPSQTGDTSYITVFVDRIHPRGSQKFIGSAFIKDNTQKAVGLATLNAINRILQIL